ncbi:RBBP9/YdeN family alpha/beta hydrolase [Aureivirga marina]|uniref:RBBP9/YdeN family alpha/beta hydrolase n=1 Tax=Aureivirga marina TaxID=1182451 RepID=UPI0018CB3E4B|nr:alpha/beta hydrolase [Aureivirga marina]
MRKIKIIVVHGYTATANSNFFPALKAELENENVEVQVLNLPNSMHPVFEDWINYLAKEIPHYDENTIFVGHSLGCVSILNFLQKKEIKIRGLYLVSGFVEEVPIPELEPFVKPKIDYAKIMKIAFIRVVYSAKDDYIIPYKLTEKMAEKLRARFILLEEGKHFKDRDGFTKFPLLERMIRANCEDTMEMLLE